MFMDEIAGAAHQNIEVYVDGSYRAGRVLYGFLVVSEGQCIHRERGELTGPVTKMHQIGGELKAVICAIAWARKHGKAVEICYDYTGIECWVGDLFGKSAWKTSNEWTARYRQYVLDNRSWVKSMRKVKAHSGHAWNDQVDAYVAATGTDILG